MLCSVLLPALLLAHTPPALHPLGDHFADAAGRRVVLRGANVSCDAKLPPFTVVRPEDLDALPQMGFNVVRLLFIWEAFEPLPGHHDGAYLEYIAGLVDAAAARGLYVVVDFHQDALSRVLIDGCGEGFPRWAVTAAVPHRTPDNGWRCRPWPIKAGASRALKRAWRGFYANEGGAREHYLDMVQRVARRLEPAANVLGYDLLNEPHGDEARDVVPLYEDAAARVHAVDPGAMIFASPGFVTSGGRPSRMPRPRVERLVYAPHVYGLWLLGAHVWFGNAQKRAFRHMQQTAHAWGTPMFIGEFGAPGGVPDARPYLRAIYAQLDAAGLSGTQWCYTRHWTPGRKDGWNEEDLSLLDDAGRSRHNFEPRPFAEAIAGRPLGAVADLARRRLELSWEHDPAAGSTDIFVPPQLHGAPRWEAHGEGLRCAPAAAGRLRCSAPTAGTMHVAIDF